MAEIVITRDGLERLSAELQHLTTAGRQEITERLRHAAVSEAEPVRERRVPRSPGGPGAARAADRGARRAARFGAGRRTAAGEWASRCRSACACANSSPAHGSSSSRRPVGVERASGRISVASPLGRVILNSVRPGRGGRRTARPASIQDPRPRDGLTDPCPRGADDLPSRLAAERVRALAERHW